MPSSFDINQLRAGAPSWAEPWRAHDKENSFAPAMVSQAETEEKRPPMVAGFG